MAETVVNNEEFVGGDPNAAATEGQFPNWVDDPASADWNTVYLNGVIIPGICSIEDLEVGIDVDTKKAKGADKPTSVDNGLRPSKFKIQVWIRAKQWPEFQSVAGSFQPRRPGRERSPLKIIHPLVNFLGIDTVRVSGIKMDTPTSKSGMKIGILCEEWFDKPVPAKTSNKPKTTVYRGTDGTPVRINEAGYLKGTDFERMQAYPLGLYKDPALTSRYEPETNVVEKSLK